MASDVIEAATLLPVARRTVWNLLTDSATYSRLFPGIGACEPVETIDGQPRWQFRIGTPVTGIRTLTVTLEVRRNLDSFVLQCAAIGSFAAVRLRDSDDHTRVTITYFAPARAHPVVAGLANAEIIAWTEAGLRRLAELMQGVPTSVVVNGEDAALRHRAAVARQIVSTGVGRTYRPDVGVKQLGRLAAWGFSLAGGYAAAAAHSPDRIAVIDDRGRRSFAEIHERSQALADGMATLGLTAGDAVGLLAHNHSGMVETMVAAGKLGVDVVLLNAGLSARQLEDTVQRHRLTTLFVDRELDHLVRYLHSEIHRYLTDTAAPESERSSIEGLILLESKGFRRPARPGRLIVLTSGTSGTPKGARRPHPKGFATVAALLSRIPLRMQETMLIPAPLFHTWGLAALQLSTALRDTVVLAERFDAEECLRLITENRVTTVILVPTMVQRILDLPVAVRARYNTSSLRVVASCGAPLAAATVLRFMDTFGDILYNIYGSTEVSWATIATPEDLRISPTTAGRPPLGTKIAVMGPDRQPLPIGATGRIYVGNHMLFDGYVNSAPPDEADGLLDTGDLGYLDATGRLFIVGRDDEMIISGGENVFPRPVEEALAHIPQITEAAVVGVPDREFGQRLAAFIVKREGTGLDPDMIRTYIRNRLSRFSVPRDVTFLDTLPRGETGKVLKRLLTGQPANPSTET
ncbi:AMP-binding protein [Nocardia nepalensis]|uniref:AMP-binding protein n=1 Tax=Nocardia nepalensis TaxID=3375448 RepID=UPI003B671708